MNRFMRSITLCAMAFAIATAAQAAEWHHVHLMADDTKAAAEWYLKYMEGDEVIKASNFDTTVFGSTQVRFKKGPAGFEGTRGTALDHIGFSFKDLDAKMAEFEAAGIEIAAPARAIGAIKFGFIVDPWGTFVEVMQDPALYGFHHIHLHTPDPDATLAWYAAAFGGEPTRYGGFLPAIQYGDMWLIAQRNAQEKVGTNGRSVDHIGWRLEGFDALAKRLEGEGTNFFVTPREAGDHYLAFIEGPEGVKIEIQSK